MRRTIRAFQRSLRTTVGGFLLIASATSVHAQTSGSSIASSSSTGTAFAVADGRTYVTNHHVIEGARVICLQPADGPLVTAQVLAVDKADDLALLRSELRAPPLPLATAAEVQRGMPVLTIGYPHPTVMGLESKVTDGIVNSLTGLRGDRRRFQISVPVQPGNSGGPLLSERGNVLGVVVSKLGLRFAEVSGDIPSNVGYAIHAARLRALLETTSELRSATGPVPSARLKDRVQLVSQAEKSVVLVVIMAEQDDCIPSSTSQPPTKPTTSPPKSPSPAQVSQEEFRRQAAIEKARLQEEERRRREAAEVEERRRREVAQEEEKRRSEVAQAEERDREEKDRRAANQAQIASELGKIAANWKDIPGSLGLALWLQVAPSGAAKVIVPDMLVKEDIEAVRQLRDYLLSATGQQLAGTAAIPLGAAELTSRGAVKACGRVERVYHEGGYFIVQTSSANTLNSAYVMTNAGWRMFRVEKRQTGRVSSLFPQGAGSVTVGSEVLAPRCD